METLSPMQICLTGLAVAVTSILLVILILGLIKAAIRVYFREKRAHLQEMVRTAPLPDDFDPTYKENING